MKKYFTYNYLFINILSITLLLVSCSDDLLVEKPESFLTPSNAFVNADGYNAAIAELHRLSRGLRTSEVVNDYAIKNFEEDKAVTTIYANGTDIASFAVTNQNQFTDYAKINSTNPLVSAYWKILYKMIANANTIVANITVSELKEEDKLRIEGNARFFRAFAYRFLVYLYGDVPLLTAEIKTPKFDFTRAPVNDILAFMKEDLEFASANLPSENPGDGQLSKAAADHILAETLISLKDYTGAIQAASLVIDNSQYALMQSRFGSSTSIDGDVFWDLFRINNQNGSSGNTESIWVWQLDFTTLNGEPKNRLTRCWGPRLERVKDSEGNRAYVVPPASIDTLGRGVGFVHPTEYLEYTIWESDFNNDIRNSKYNMQRRFTNNNPASPEFGQMMVPRASDLSRNHNVFVKKTAAREGYPQGYDTDGRMYTDMYAIRLAETYLLRAEAYFLNGDNTNSTADINIIRNRAQATPIASSLITLDYILDERARELVSEEPRRLTLARMNKLAERVRLYNPVSAPSIQDFHNLWPIPQDAIDANLEAELIQNPGY
jgi:hypothetical protein